jgi:hypothetical protein
MKQFKRKFALIMLLALSFNTFAGPEVGGGGGGALTSGEYDQTIIIGKSDTLLIDLVKIEDVRLKDDQILNKNDLIKKFIMDGSFSVDEDNNSILLNLSKESKVLDILLKDGELIDSSIFSKNLN